MKFKRLRAYRLRFYDHSSGYSWTHPGVVCNTLGYYLKEDDNFYFFSWWEVEDRDSAANNREFYRVVKGALVEATEWTDLPRVPQPYHE